MTPLDETGNEALTIIAAADKFNKWMFDTLSPYVEGHTLEIGSGIGNITQFLVQLNIHISISDIDSYYLKILRNKLSNQKNVCEFLTIDLQAPSFYERYATLKERFDTIILTNVLEHLQDDKYALQNCKYLLKKEGTLILLVPAYSWLYSRMDKELGHYRRYTKKRMQKLLKAAEMKPLKGFYFNALGIIAWLYGKIFFLKVVPQKEMIFFNRLIPIAKIIDKITLSKIGLSVIVVSSKKK